MWKQYLQFLCILMLMVSKFSILQQISVPVCLSIDSKEHIPRVIKLCSTKSDKNQQPIRCTLRTIQCYQPIEYWLDYNLCHSCLNSVRLTKRMFIRIVMTFEHLG